MHITLYIVYQKETNQSKMQMLNKKLINILFRKYKVIYTTIPPFFVIYRIFLEISQIKT